MPNQKELLEKIKFEIKIAEKEFDFVKDKLSYNWGDFAEVNNEITELEKKLKKSKNIFKIITYKIKIFIKKKNYKKIEKNLTELKLKRDESNKILVKLERNEKELEKEIKNEKQRKEQEVAKKANDKIRNKLYTKIKQSSYHLQEKEKDRHMSVLYNEKEKQQSQNEIFAI